MAAAAQTAQPSGMGTQIGQAAGAAAGTAVAPVIGTAIGAAIGGIVGGLFGGGQGKTFAQASSELHQWIRQNLHSEATLNWIKQNYPKAFTDKDTLRKLQWIYLMNHDPNVQPPGDIVMVGSPRHWVGDSWRTNAAFFRELGIDADASDAAAKAEDPNWQAGSPSQYANRWKKSHIVYTAPSQQAVQVMQGAKDKADAGLPLNKAEQQIMNSLNKAANPFSMSSVIPLLLIAVALIFIFRRA